MPLLDNRPRRGRLNYPGLLEQMKAQDAAALPAYSMFGAEARGLDPIPALSGYKSGDRQSAIEMAMNFMPMGMVRAAPFTAKAGTTIARDLPLATTQGGKALDKLAFERGIKGKIGYHGSPHKFDLFADEAIGTGEGAQTYGYGHYIAENPGVAKDYQRNLSYKKTTRDFLNALPENAEIDDVLDEIGSGIFTPAQERVIKELNADDWLGFDYPSQAISAAYRPDALKRWDMSPALQKAVKETGHLYKTGLNVTDDAVLHWDKPLSEQPKRVQEALDGLSSFQRLKKGHGEFSVEDMAELGIVADNPVGWMPTGEELMGSFIHAGYGRQDIAKQLHDAGIKGIKYLDQGSRGSGKGTHNYVMFDPTDIAILGKE